MWWASVSCVFHIWKVTESYISGQVSRRRWFFDFLSSTNKKLLKLFGERCFSIHTNREDFWHRYEKLPRKRGCLEKQVRIVIIDLGKLVQSTVSFKYIPPSGRSQVFPDFELEFAIQLVKVSSVQSFRFPGDSWARAIKRCKNWASSNSSYVRWIRQKVHRSHRSVSYISISPDYRQS